MRKQDLRYTFYPRAAIVAALGFFLLTLSSPALIHACECEPPNSISEAVDQADLVFWGEVVQVNTNWISGGMKYGFKVEKSWIKPTDTFLIVNTGWEEQDCGDSFEMGKRYLVFGHKRFTLKTDRCSGNMALETASDIPAELGLGFDPRQGPMVVKMYWTISILGILALLFVAVVVLRKRMFGQRE